MGKDTAIATIDEVKQALGKVQDPGLGRDLIAARMVRDVSVNGGKARVEICLTTPLCPSREEIAATTRTAVKGVAGVEDVEVVFSADVATKFGPAPERLRSVRNVIAVAAGKGGVGKSTVATNLAVALARGGAAVGIMIPISRSRVERGRASAHISVSRGRTSEGGGTTPPPGHPK